MLKLKKYAGLVLAGMGAGAVNGLFGAGGGMVLVPLLSRLTDLEDREVFAGSVCIILPVCLISLFFTFQAGVVTAETVILYLLGSAAGGILAGIFGRRIPTLWLHRLLGIFILWGGIRYLC